MRLIFNCRTCNVNVFKAAIREHSVCKYACQGTKTSNTHDSFHLLGEFYHQTTPKDLTVGHNILAATGNEKISIQICTVNTPFYRTYLVISLRPHHNSSVVSSTSINVHQRVYYVRHQRVFVLVLLTRIRNKGYVVIILATLRPQGRQVQECEKTSNHSSLATKYLNCHGTYLQIQLPDIRRSKNAISNHPYKRPYNKSVVTTHSI